MREGRLSETTQAAGLLDGIRLLALVAGGLCEPIDLTPAELLSAGM